VRTTINFNQLILNPPYPINPKRPLVDVPGITAGVFRIKPYHTTLAREIDYNSDRKPGSIVLQLSATCEPKTSLFDDNATCSAIDLIDENGHAFRPSGPIPPLVGLSSRGTVAIGIGFPETATMGTHLKSLKGTLTADVQTASKFIEFADLTNVGQSFDIGNGASLQLTSVTVDSEYTSIEIGLTETADLPPQVRRIMNDPGHALELFDSEGRRLFTVSVERKPRGQPNSPVWSIRIRRSTGDPKIVKVEIATASRQVSVPFELDDVSLPVPVAK
jgi:hypothetical protein